MSAVSRATSVDGRPPLFIPPQPQKISLTDFNVKFEKDRTIAIEDSPVKYEDLKPIVAPGVGDCIALLAVHVSKATQRVEFYAGYHMTRDIGSAEVDGFLDLLDDREYDLYLYLIGGNGSDGSIELLQTIKDSLKKTFEGRNHVVSELINLVKKSSASEEVISIGLTKDGEVFWCFGEAD